MSNVNGCLCFVKVQQRCTRQTGQYAYRHGLQIDQLTADSENGCSEKFQIDMNPIKHATIKEIEASVKRNIARYKEKYAPAIKKEINQMYQER